MVVAFFCSLLVAAPPSPDAGFSGERLAHLRRQLELDVRNKAMPGAVLLIQRDGKPVRVETAGFRDRRAQAPMKADAIFRIASMTKPVVTVGAMMLAEEGALDLASPVARYLPEFANVRVRVERTVPKRPMTVLDLMRHTSGLTYGLFGNTPVDQLYRDAKLFEAPSLEEMVKRIAALPLLHEPGEFWEYSVSTDVLARVVEVVSGLPLDRFLAERVFGPLKMRDSGYQVKDLSRVAQPDGAMNMPPEDLTRRPALVAGGHGLLATAQDYARFCQMLLNGGELEGVRLLSPRSVAMMTADQLAPGVERHTPVAAFLDAFGPVPEMATSFGLGFGVRTALGLWPRLRAEALATRGIVRRRRRGI